MREDDIKKMFNECNVGRLLGIEVTELKKGSAKGKFPVRKEHLNIFGDAHGGMIFAFADHIGGACANTLGGRSVLVESSIQCLKGASGEQTIFAEASMSHRGKRIGRVDVKVFEEGGAIIALTHQIFYIKDDGRRQKAAEDI
ncbi:MAG TPA: PaaI family thioesterase [Syntrophorhabdaceae bacterium]|jgi:acyl-CoA thioesterase